MYFCKSKTHVWKNKTDAKKCCNGWERMIVFGEKVPADAENIKLDENSGVKYCKIWIKEDPSMALKNPYEQDNGFAQI